MDIAKFIQDNNLKLRTEEEIKAKIHEWDKQGLMFDFRKDVLITHLSFEGISEFLKPEYVAEVNAGTKEKPELHITIEQAAQNFLEYMEFAFGKAADQRGLSANGSIQKLSAWLWLMSCDEAYDIINDDNLYNPYGAPALIAVCDKMGIEVADDFREFAKVKC